MGSPFAMGKLINTIWRDVRRRPWLLALGILLLLGVCFFMAVDSWALARYRSAQQLLREEKFAEAIVQVEQCLRVRWWQTSDTYFLAARLKRLVGKYDEAGKYLDKSVALRG